MQKNSNLVMTEHVFRGTTHNIHVYKQANGEFAIRIEQLSGGVGGLSLTLSATDFAAFEQCVQNIHRMHTECDPRYAYSASAWFMSDGKRSIGFYIENLQSNEMFIRAQYGAPYSRQQEVRMNYQLTREILHLLHLAQ